jgi:hypothetical protein
MDLIALSKKRGRGALKELGRRAGLPDGYIYHIAHGRRGLNIDRAEKLVALEPELDLLALLRIKKRDRRTKKSSQPRKGASGAVENNRRASSS